MTKEEAKQATAGCVLVHTATTNTNARKHLADLHEYTGKYGSGYTISTDHKTEVYVYPTNQIDAEIYAGKYSIHDECRFANLTKKVQYKPKQGDPVWVTPTWQITLDTVNGKTEIRRVSEYKPIAQGGRTLTVCFFGTADERKLRLKIRRKMKEMLTTGKARLVTSWKPRC